MPFVETSLEIVASKHACYNIAKDMERYPEFMENVKSVTIVESGPGYTVTDWVTNVDGRTIKWKEKDMLDNETPKIVYHQISGDLKKFEGEWRFEEKDGKTKVVLTVDFDLGIPMLSTLLNPILKKKVRSNSEAMLEAIKKQVETR